MVDLVDQVALLALRRGRPDDAARLAGRGITGFAGTNTRRDIVEQRIHGILMTELRGHFDVQALESLLTDGAAMSDGQAVRKALGMQTDTA